MSGFVAMLDTSGAPIDGRLLRNMMDVPPYDAASGVVWAAGRVGLGASPLRSPHHLDASQPLACGDRLRMVMDGRLDDRAALVRRLEAGLDRRLGAASDVALRARRVRAVGHRLRVAPPWRLFLLRLGLGASSPVLRPRSPGREAALLTPRWAGHSS